MQRFFLNQKIEDPREIIITDKAIINKIVKVLRKQAGDTVFIFDLDANEYEVEIQDISKQRIVCKFLNKSFIDRELPVSINLYQAVLKKDNLEWVVQKATEIGVKSITPIIAENCVIKELNKNKKARYEKIINEATIQSGGKIQPQFLEAIDFESALSQLDSISLNIIAHEQEETVSLKDLLQPGIKEINLFIGPEGGFSPDEINLALRNSVKPFSLGKRILRAETAAVVACGTLAQLLVN